MIEFNAGFASNPGEVISDYLDFYGFSQKWLAERLGCTEKHICKVISGDAPISADIAIKLSTVIGSTADFWLSMENSYKIYMARLVQEKHAEIESNSEIFEKIPYSDLVRLGWIQPARKPKERVLNLYRFFNISSLDCILKTQSVAFRRNNNKRINEYAVAAWLQKGENIIKSERFNTRYDSKRLKASLKEILSVAHEMPDDFFKRVVDILADCGVVLIAVQYLKNTYINGATRWIGNNPVIQLSDRGKSDDILWFTLFHEIGHVLMHSKKSQFLDIDDDIINEQEEEANIFASESLLADKLLERFLDDSISDIDEKRILDFSRRYNISASVLVGRLEHRHIVPYYSFSEMHKKIKIIN